MPRISECAGKASEFRWIRIMMDPHLKVVQCNCQRAYAVMCDMGVMLGERRVSVALLQEPYVKDGRVLGLPLSMDVIVCENGCVRVAVVVNDPKLDVMCVRECTDECGVCV